MIITGAPGIGTELGLWPTLTPISQTLPHTKPRGRPIKKDVPRYQAEQTFAWFQRKYRRLVVRWERPAACFPAFLAMAMIHMWVHKLIVG
jgi:hypothetical protein